MVLLSPKFQKRQIRWKEWATGRVLEVRAFLSGSRITFLAVYQHVWSSNKTQQHNKSDRASVLSSLTKAIKQVPQRDTLIVAGDFKLADHDAVASRATNGAAGGPASG